MKLFVLAFLVASTLIAGSNAGTGGSCDDVSEILKQLSPAVTQYIKDLIKNIKDGLKGKSFDDSHAEQFKDLVLELPQKREATENDKLLIRSLESKVEVDPRFAYENIDTLIQKCFFKLVFELNLAS